MRHACEKVSQLTSERLERRLSLLEWLHLRVHLLMCGACRRYDAHILKLHTLLSQHRQQQQLDLPPQQRQKIKKALDDTVKPS
ncbi:MAG: hypothetical protein Q9M19_01590 [Mariprofundaceae bacterium]|nr:hypothetical protein [Mariprofundaceae bacterium]